MEVLWHMAAPFGFSRTVFICSSKAIRANMGLALSGEEMWLLKWRAAFLLLFPVGQGLPDWEEMV